MYMYFFHYLSYAIDDIKYILNTYYTNKALVLSSSRVCSHGNNSGPSRTS